MMLSFSFSFAADFSLYFYPGSYTNFTYGDDYFDLSSTSSSRGGFVDIRTSGHTTFTVNFNYSGYDLYNISDILDVNADNLPGYVNNLVVTPISGCELKSDGYDLEATALSGSFSVSYDAVSMPNNVQLLYMIVRSTYPCRFNFTEFTVNNNSIITPEPPSSVGNGYLTNGLPVGNVIYFDLGSSGVEYDITLKSYFTSKSSWFGSTWVNDNRRYGFTDELPTTATNFSESSGSSIPWSPSGSTDLLGRSDEGSAVLSGTSTARYLWILNPLYNLGYYDEPDKGSSLNGNIFYIGGISVDTPYYIYSLKQSATSLGLSSDVASSVGGVGSVTSSGAINTVVNDGSGTEYIPSVGGDNSAPQEVSATEGIKQTLDQFVQMFLNIFTAPISHIQQLINMGSEFISHLSGLWSWMPSEISGFVISAFVVMVAISIFKLFL